MRSILALIQADPRAAPFKTAVKDTECPSYSLKVKQPMDFGKISREIYKDKDAKFSLGRLEELLGLVFANCISYHPPDSSIVAVAKDLQIKFEKCMEVVRSVIEQDSKLIDVKKLQSSGSSKKSKVGGALPLNDIGKKLSKILKKLLEDPRSGPFRDPVKFEDFPDYKEKIAQPSCLSEISQNLLKYQDHDRMQDFFNDVNLVFQNAMEYNREESGIYASAKSLRALASDLYTTMLASLKPKSSAPLPAAVSPPAMRAFAMRNVKFFEDAAGSHIVNGISVRASDLRRILKNPSECSQYSNPAHYSALALSASPVPFVVAPGILEVLNWGEINKQVSRFQDLLIPINFVSARSLRLSIVPLDLPLISTVDSANGFSFPFVQLDLRSLVCLDSDGGLVFKVLLPNGTVVAHSDTPRGVWEKVLGRKEDILRALGSKMRRCRAVFNRLCIEPDCLPFFDPVVGDLAAHYDSVIVAPMWLREVHARLVEGAYEDEFDFAFDMRLIFRNCMRYNAPGSLLYLSAQRMYELFDTLMCEWVHNPHDRSLDDLAKGPWDDWQYLRYFDAPSPEGGVCYLTGTHAPDSQLLQCAMCEEQFLPSALNLDIHPSTKDWKCTRCQAATNVASASGSKPVGSQRDNKYTREEIGGLTYAPAPDVGPGWMQARRKGRYQMQNSYMSPLGYGPFSKDEIGERCRVEEAISTNLELLRQTDYREQQAAILSGKQLSRGNKSRKGRNSAFLKNAGERVGVTAALTHEVEEIVPGNLANFSLPQGHRLEWFRGKAESDHMYQVGDGIHCQITQEGNIMWQDAKIESINYDGTFNVKLDGGSDARSILITRIRPYGCLEAKATSHTTRVGQPGSPVGSLHDYVVVHPANLPPSGFFGLHLHEVRLRVEGLPGVSNLPDFSYINSQILMQGMLKDATEGCEKLTRLSQADAALVDLVARERWFWRLHREQNRRLSLQDAMEQTISTPTIAERGVKVTLLVDESIAQSRDENANAYLSLCLWNFFDIASSIVGETAMGLFEIIKAIREVPKRELPSPRQAAFDEIGCFITSFLLQEMRQFVGGPKPSRASLDSVFQDILMYKPLNIMTWQCIARGALLVVSQEFTPAAARVAAKYTPFGDADLQQDIICLLTNHPRSGPLLRRHTTYPLNSDIILKGVASDLMVLRIRTLYFEHKLEGRFYDSMDQFVADVVGLLEGSIAQSAEGEEQHDAALVILEYFRDLCTRMNIAVPALPLQSNFIHDLPENVPDADSSSDLHLPKPRVHLATGPSGIKGSTPLRGFCGADEYILTPAVISNTQPVLDEIQLLEYLERTLRLLREKESEQWTLSERIVVLTTLVHFCLVSELFEELIGPRERDLPSAHLEVSDVPDKLDNIAIAGFAPLEFVEVSRNSEIKCHFTGLEARHIDPSFKWVKVPPLLLAPPISPLPSEHVDGQSGYNIRTETSSPPGVILALEAAVQTIIAARYVAAQEESVYDDKLKFLRQQLFTDRMPATEKHHVFPLTSKTFGPIGIDGAGWTYWIFRAQERSPCFYYGSSYAFVSQNPMPVVYREPCVLVCRPDGVMGLIQSGSERTGVEKLWTQIRPDIPCEALLHGGIVERLAYIQKQLWDHTPILKPHKTHSEWLLKRFRLESDVLRALNDLKLDGLSVVDWTNTLEMLFAASAEVRTYIHGAMNLYREPDYSPGQSSSANPKLEKELFDRRNRNVLEKCGENLVDFHPTHGFLRSDSVSLVHRLLPSTTNSKCISVDAYVEWAKYSMSARAELLHNHMKPTHRLPPPMHFFPSVVSTEIARATWDTSRKVALPPIAQQEGASASASSTVGQEPQSFQGLVDNGKRFNPPSFAERDYNSAQLSSWPHFISSTVRVSGRLARLKAEVINLLLTFRDKIFDWYQLEKRVRQFSSQSTKEAMDIDAVDASKGGLHQERLAAIREVMERIQAAETPDVVLSELVRIEEALPQSMLLSQYSSYAMPYAAPTCAALAVRIYSLDRSLAVLITGRNPFEYDPIYAMKRPFKPRDLMARCCASTTCKLPLWHSCRCTDSLNVAPFLASSRLPDIKPKLQLTFEAQQGKWYTEAELEAERLAFNDQKEKERIKYLQEREAALAQLARHKQLQAQAMQQQVNVVALKRPDDDDVYYYYHDEEAVAKRRRDDREILVDIHEVEPYKPAPQELQFFEEW